jgi:hypothetical protein
MKKMRQKKKKQKKTIVGWIPATKKTNETYLYSYGALADATRAHHHQCVFSVGHPSFFLRWLSLSIAPAAAAVVVGLGPAG